MNKQILIDKYDLAMKAVRDSKTGDIYSEVTMGKAYQQMVKAGIVAQIKKKYRG